MTVDNPEPLPCTCIYSPGDEGYVYDPKCPTHKDGDGA